MKEIIFTGWNVWRIIRLILAIIFLVAGFWQTDYFLAAGGGFVFMQALFNAGCCTGGHCGVNYNGNNCNIEK